MGGKKYFLVSMILGVGEIALYIFQLKSLSLEKVVSSFGRFDWHDQARARVTLLAASREGGRRGEGEGRSSIKERGGIKGGRGKKIMPG